jgi:hypothetical protein
LSSSAAPREIEAAACAEILDARKEAGVTGFQTKRVTNVMLRGPKKLYEVMMHEVSTQVVS